MIDDTPRYVVIADGTPTEVDTLADVAAITQTATLTQIIDRDAICRAPP